MNISLVNSAWLMLPFLLFGNALYAQDVAIIDGKPVKTAEFLWVYQKNNAQETKRTYKELSDYLNLYVNFKLKVAEAKSLGLDRQDSYKEEIAGYEQALRNQGKAVKQPQEYTYIMNEYKEGVLMFNISEQKIWNKIANDELALQAFYNQQKQYKGKNFDDIRGQLIEDYQHKLEKDWIKDLKTKFAVKINQAELKKLAKQ